MSRYVTRDGRELTWTGHNICICTKCDEIFNSVTAFDHHIRYGEGKGRNRTVFEEAVHDTSGMPRNSRGYLVTALRVET